MRKTMIVAATILAALGTAMAQSNASAKDDGRVSCLQLTLLSSCNL
jgi:hypothetical protein